MLTPASDSQAETPRAELLPGRKGRLYGGPVVLNGRMLRMIRLMVEGFADDPSKTPLGLFDAAAAVGYRRSAAKGLAQSPIFVDAWRAALEANAKGEAAPNQLPTLAEWLENLRLRGVRDQLMRQRDDARNENRRLKGEIFQLRAELGQPRPAAAGAPGYVIRLDREREANDG